MTPEAFVVTTAINYTLWLGADGQPEYHCLRGEIHRGEHGLYECAQHDCEHPSALLLIDTAYLICGHCGRTWDWE